MGKYRDYIIHDEFNIKGFFGDYRFLSNFHLAPVWYEGILYQSTEHAYQAAKSIDINERLKYKDITCSKAKKLGNELPIRDNWDIIKYDVMFSVCLDKFTRHNDLRQLLLGTGSRYLEETNHWNDVYWGFCNGDGQNNLGKILMLIRKILKSNPNNGFNI